jgi:hypothetical protein
LITPSNGVTYEPTKADGLLEAMRSVRRASYDREQIARVMSGARWEEASRVTLAAMSKR